MPVLPGSDQAQVINPGTPIPVGSTGEARYQGETIENFGKALTMFGEVLDAAGKKAKAEEDKLLLQSAENRFRMAMLEKRAARAAAAPMQGDQTGFGGVQAMQEELLPIQSQIADEFADENLKGAFLARSGDLFNDLAPVVWADEVKKRADNNQVLLDKVISESGQLARMSPDLNDTQFMLDRVEKTILENDDIAPAVKPVEIARAKKSVLIDSMQGRLRDRDYVGASLALDRYGNGVFSPEEKAKYLDEIQQTEWKDIDRDLKEIARTEKQAEKLHKKQEDEYVAYLSTALQQAGNNEQKRQPIINDIARLKAAGLIKPERADSLIGNTTFRDTEDDIQDFNITSKAIKTGNYVEAIDEVTKARGTKLSYDRAEKMIDRLKQLQDREKADPNKRRVIQSGENLIRSQLKSSITDVMSDLDKRELQKKVELSVQQYYKEVYNNPDADPTKISKRILKNNFGASTKIIPGTQQIYGTDTVQGLQTLLDKTIKNAQGLKASGRMTKEKNKEVVNQIKAIQDKMNEIRNNKADEGEDVGGRPVNTNPSSPGTRGR